MAYRQQQAERRRRGSIMTLDPGTNGRQKQQRQCSRERAARGAKASPCSSPLRRWSLRTPTPRPPGEAGRVEVEGVGQHQRVDVGPAVGLGVVGEGGEGRRGMRAAVAEGPGQSAWSTAHGTRDIVVNGR